MPLRRCASKQFALPKTELRTRRRFALGRINLYKCFLETETAMNPWSSAITVLTAMITPAVLISACGSRILSTSSRLGRVVDRVRALSEKLEEISRKDQQTDLTRERQAAIFEQLDK